MRAGEKPVDAAIDNKTRTVADVRHILSKNGGNLGSEGSVSFMFKHCGQFFFAPGSVTEDDVMGVALDAGADDVIVDEEGGIEVVCEPNAFEAVNEAFEKAGMKPEMAEVTMKALNETELSGEDAERMQRLIDALEDLDDVQQVYTTAVFD